MRSSSSLLVVVLLLLVSVRCHNIGTFIQLTDIHYDSRYTQGAPNNCFMGDIGLGCCRKDSVAKEPYGPAGLFGDYNCDLPKIFIEESFEWVRKNLDTPDFILWTGDNVDHHDISQTLELNVEEVNVVARLIAEYFPAVQVYGILGNHDTWPIDQLKNNFNETYLSKNVTALFTELDWLNKEALDQFRFGGYYNISLGGNNNNNNNMQIVAINSLYYDNNNLELYLNPQEDPVSQWNWLETTFRWCNDTGRQVWLLGHIPPVSSEATLNFSKKFIALIHKYTNTVINQFWGHTHNDQFLLYIDQNNFTVSGHAYVAPSLLPRAEFSQFPSIRQYIYDRETFEILDYRQYNCDLTMANVKKQVVYNMYYSAKKNYKLRDLSKDSWYYLYRKMYRSTNLILNYWHKYNPGLEYECGAICQKYLLKEISLQIFSNDKHVRKIDKPKI